MSAFGWCHTGHHSACPVKIQRWYHGKERKGRKMVDAVVYLEEYKECGCHCHKPEVEKPKRRKKGTKK